MSRGDRHTYFDLIAPIAAIVFSDKDELIKFLRYKPAFYHNAIKSNELYPGWKKQFENSVSGEKEKNLLKNYKDSKYTVDSNGNMKLLDWEMTDTEYNDFKKKQKVYSLDPDNEDEIANAWKEIINSMPWEKVKYLFDIGY